MTAIEDMSVKQKIAFAFTLPGKGFKRRHPLFCFKEDGVIIEAVAKPEGIYYRPDSLWPQLAVQDLTFGEEEIDRRLIEVKIGGVIKTLKFVHSGPVHRYLEEFGNRECEPSDIEACRIKGIAKNLLCDMRMSVDYGASHSAMIWESDDEPEVWTGVDLPPDYALDDFDRFGEDSRCIGPEARREIEERIEENNKLLTIRSFCRLFSNQLFSISEAQLMKHLLAAGQVYKTWNGSVIPANVSIKNELMVLQVRKRTRKGELTKSYTTKLTTKGQRFIAAKIIWAAERQQGI